MLVGPLRTLLYCLVPPLFGLSLLAKAARRGGPRRVLVAPFHPARVADTLDRAGRDWGTLGRLYYAWGYLWAFLVYGALAVGALVGLGVGVAGLVGWGTERVVPLPLAGGAGALLGALVLLYHARSLLRGLTTGDVSLRGEWKHESAEAERAHRRAQRRDPPVDVGEHVTLAVTEVDPRENEVYGTVESFRLFVDRDVPSSVGRGDVICVRITTYATNDEGLEVGGHARFVSRGPCD